LEAATDKGGTIVIPIRDKGSVNFLVKHPFNSVKLVLEIREAIPQRARSDRHWIGLFGLCVKKYNVITFFNFF
jgi:hypothetical protein